MKIVVWCLMALAAGLMLAGRADAGAGYASSVVGFNNSTGYSLTKLGKISIKPSVKAGDGGLVLSFKLAGVSCTGVDGSEAGKCGDPNPVVNHVLDVTANVAGNDLNSIAGVKYSITGGKAAFQATGKGKIGGAVFGPLVSIIFNQPLGFGIMKLREPGSDPSDCDAVPLAPGNGCTDGDPYAVSGIIVGSDPGVSCSSDAQCGPTGLCQSGTCATETCTVDADCDQGGGSGGTGECGSNGQCCDPDIDPTCASQVP